jgi:hypothetical protein
MSALFSLANSQKGGNMPSSFSFTNTTANTHKLTPIDLKPVTNYGVLQSKEGECTLSNITAGADQPELLTYTYGSRKSVNSKAKSIYTKDADPNSACIEYRFRVDELLREVDANSNILRDYPIVAEVRFVHELAAPVSATIIAGLLDRLLGTIMKTDGSLRINDSMHGAIKPVAD